MEKDRGMERERERERDKHTVSVHLQKVSMFVLKLQNHNVFDSQKSVSNSFHYERLLSK